MDTIELDFKTRGGKKCMLLMLNVATGGLRVKGIKHKHEVSKHFDEYIVEESLHKREMRVTVGADGDGAMALVKDAARKRGVAFLPIPPYSPHLNPVEGVVNIFKQAVTSMLLSACTEEGPLIVANGLWAAEYVCHVHGRWCKERYYDTYRGGYTEMQSPWRLNMLTEARLDRIPPWGTPGYAYVPADLHKARGAPKYVRKW